MEINPFWFTKKHLYCNKDGCFFDFTKERIEYGCLNTQKAFCAEMKGYNFLFSLQKKGTLCLYMTPPQSEDQKPAFYQCHIYTDEKKKEITFQYDPKAIHPNVPWLDHNTSDLHFYHDEIHGKVCLFKQSKNLITMWVFDIEREKMQKTTFQTNLSPKTITGTIKYLLGVSSNESSYRLLCFCKPMETVEWCFQTIEENLRQEYRVFMITFHNSNKSKEKQEEKENEDLSHPLYQVTQLETITLYRIESLYVTEPNNNKQVKEIKITALPRFPHSESEFRIIYFYTYILDFTNPCPSLILQNTSYFEYTGSPMRTSHTYMYENFSLFPLGKSVYFYTVNGAFFRIDVETENLHQISIKKEFQPKKKVDGIYLEEIDDDIYLVFQEGESVSRNKNLKCIKIAKQ